MSEKGTGRGRPADRRPGDDKQRAREATSFLARTLSVVGLLLAVLGFVAPFIFGPAVGASVALQAVAALLGAAGYGLGARRLGGAAVILSVLAIFFALAASQGLIPGFESYDRGLPDAEPGSDNPSGEL